MADDVKTDERTHTDPLVLSRRRKTGFFVFSAFLVLLLIAGNLLYGTTLFTRNNRTYCLSCHQFSQPAHMWEPSEMHSEGFACSPCHSLLPGQEGRCGAFSAHADTVNPNCMGCHPRVLEGRTLGKVVEVHVSSPESPEGKEARYTWNLEDLMYRWHVSNRVCVCTDCHRNVAHDEVNGPLPRNRPEMTSCQGCHYHAVKDDYVKALPLPVLKVKEKDELPPQRALGSAGDPARTASQVQNLLHAKVLHLSGGKGTAYQVPEGNLLIYELQPRAFHQKGEMLVKATGKDCGECHGFRSYPQEDFFGWEYRKKWILQWWMASVAGFVMLAGLFNAFQFWGRGKQVSLHHPVHWPSVAGALVNEGILGRRVYRQSRLRWAVFLLISVAFLALALVFGTMVLARFILPAGNLLAARGGPALDFLADFLGGAILLGVLLALFRRTLGREDHMKSDPEDFVILFLLLAIMLTGFFMEACRLAVVSAGPGYWASFLGALTASGLRLWDLPWTAIRFYVWIVHAALVFSLLAYLPFSKLFHLITAPVSIAATASEAHYRQHQ